MASKPPDIRAPLEAPPARQFLHGVIAAAGWVLFVWWWWIVLQRISVFEIRFTAWFLAISLVIIAGVTTLWAMHNQRIFQQKGARTGLQVVEEDHSRDVLGCPVEFPASPEDCLIASVVVVRFEEGRKIYHPALLGGRSERKAGS
jgi:hypothetical protein